MTFRRTLNIHVTRTSRTKRTSLLLTNERPGHSHNANLSHTSGAQLSTNSNTKDSEVKVFTFSNSLHRANLLRLLSGHIFQLSSRVIKGLNRTKQGMRHSSHTLNLL